MAILLASMHLQKKIIIIIFSFSYGWKKKHVLPHIPCSPHTAYPCDGHITHVTLNPQGINCDALNKVGDFSLPHFLDSVSYVHTTSRTINNRPFKFIQNNDYFFFLTFLDLGSHSLATFHLYFTKWEERLGAGGSSDLSWFKS